jgi:hypothetical protein
VKVLKEAEAVVVKVVKKILIMIREVRQEVRRVQGLLMLQGLLVVFWED